MIGEITVQAAHSRLKSAPDGFCLLDCRDAAELDLARIEPAKHIPMHEVASRVGELEPDKTWAVICHHGVRSLYVAKFLEQEGFRGVLNVSGGIDAYARDVDPSIPRY